MTSNRDVEPFHLTNRGLKLKVPVLMDSVLGPNRRALCAAILLNCHYKGRPDVPLGVRLFHKEGNVWLRHSLRAVRVSESVLARAKVEKIYIGL